MKKKRVTANDCGLRCVGLTGQGSPGDPKGFSDNGITEFPTMLRTRAEPCKHLVKMFARPRPPHYRKLMPSSKNMKGSQEGEPIPGAHAAVTDQTPNSCKKLVS